MTRHGLNATNSAVYSYHEKKKDQKAAGFGAEKIRMSKDAIKGFDCCSLTLQPTSRPVITPQGYIFDKVLFASGFLYKWSITKLTYLRTKQDKLFNPP